MVLQRGPVTDRDVTCGWMVVVIGAVFTVVGVKTELLRASEDTETALVKPGSVTVEYVVGLTDDVMEDDMGEVVVDGTGVVELTSLVVENDLEQQNEVEVEGEPLQLIYL